ncbi:glycerophosphodiester phosphodiesterase family protein [Nonomuraea sp. NPDC049784]|uniref:glycerophosphodiester phosphodiesterase n=1 Tax=Nonomuraea sp. NPDC049784 TaxID=3154361 RepID=UPI0033F86FEA
MYRPLGATVTAALATVAALACMPGAAHASPSVDNIAHRGGAAYGPENTIAACALARMQRADACEFDIQQTKDQQLVLIHDQTLSRTTNVEQLFPDRSPWKVADFTLAEIRRLDAGSWFSSRFRGEKVPTLEEALRAMGRYNIGLLLDVKHSPGDAGIDQRVADLLKRNRSLWSGRGLVVQAFDWNAMRSFHRMMPEVPINLLGKPDLNKLSDLGTFAKALSLPRSSITPEVVRAVHAKGMRVYTGPTDRPGVLRRLVSYGVDGIMTNRPGQLDSIERYW